MDDRGELKWFLGIDFKRLPDRKIEMSQERYVKSILERFKISDSKVAITPAEKHFILRPRDENELSPSFPYRHTYFNWLSLTHMTGSAIVLFLQCSGLLCCTVMRLQCPF